MYKKIFILLPVVFTAFTGMAFGQYQKDIHRQTAEEIAMVKNQEIQIRAIYIRQADNSVPFEVDHFDTGGRVLLIANPKHHEHFTYDDAGRMSHWQDSANDGRRFEKFDYYFGYDGSGRLDVYKTARTVSRFTPAGQDLKEDVLRNNIVVEKHLYSFDPDGKPVSELFTDTAGKPIYRHKLFYNKYGDLASEVTVNFAKDCRGDSAATINTYNNKGKIIHKQVTRGGQPNCPGAAKTEAESYTYTYNAAGQLTTETMTSTHAEQSYRKEYTYTMSGLPSVVLGFDGKGKSTSDLVYSYVYFPKKKH